MGTVPPLNHVVLVGSVVDSDKLLLMSAEGLQRLRHVDAIAQQSTHGGLSTA